MICFGLLARACCGDVAKVELVKAEKRNRRVKSRIYLYDNKSPLLSKAQIATIPKYELERVNRIGR